MPLWLLAAALAAAPLRVASAAPQTVSAQTDAPQLDALDRALLLEAKYQIGSDGVRTPAPESRLLEEQDLTDVLLRLRAEQSRKALTDLEGLQDEYFKNGGKLSREQVLKGQVTLAKNWILLPDQAREGFNSLLKEAGGKPVGGPDLAWVQRVTASWDKALAGTLPEAAAGPAGPAVASTPQVLMRPPPPAEVARRIARVDAATYKDPDTGKLTPYPDDVKRGLREVMRYAAPEDSDAVLRVLEKRHPLITRSNAEMFANADGVAHAPGANETGLDAYYRLALPDSYVYAPPPPGQKDGVQVPFVEAHFYKDMGVPPPALDAYSGVQPTKITRKPEGEYDDYPDGSWRFKPTPEAQADVILHEILHLDTGSEGGGAHQLTNEMRSYYAQERFQYNRDQQKGAAAEQGGGEGLWLKKPLEFRARVLGVYMSPAVGEVQTDRVLVSQQLAETDRALAATGAEFDRLRQAELERRMDILGKSRRAIYDDMEHKKLLTHDQAEAGRQAVDAMIASIKRSPDYQNWDYRAVLREEHRRLLRDQATALQIVGQDVDFHRLHGIPYAGAPK